jgi:hypothetical protein
MLVWWIVAAGKAKNVGNTVVLARLFNEASGHKTPSKIVRLIMSGYLLPRVLRTLFRQQVKVITQNLFDLRFYCCVRRKASLLQQRLYNRV